MERAIELAKECFDEGEVPVGAVIVQDEKIIGEGKNKVISDNDVTSHAEINAKKLMKLFNNIKSFYPKNSSETEKVTKKCNYIKGPTFINLKTDKYLNSKW